jgi:ribonucleoside-triphosphate reductase
LKTLTAARDAYAQNEIKDAEAPELSLYQRQLHQAKYARWLEDENRRETWPETVQRYVNFISEYIAKYHCDLDPAVYDDIREAILRMDVLPSMRGLMTAGKAAWRDQTSLYNCAALSIDRAHAFDEALYLLCAGVGVGFSVENKYIAKLPEVPSELHYSDSVIVVPDSKIGWATSLRQLIAMLYAGLIPKWDLSRIRPEGARLKTMGGRASGKRPLAELFNFTVEVFQQAKGRKLNSLEVHSIMCKIGDIVVVGGVRRAALLSLSDPSDARMRDAKSGQWWEDSPWLALANNSAAWEEKPDINHFMEEWMGLMRSGSGERGIFNRKAAQAKAMKYGREPLDFLTNPCGEILLNGNPGQLCNLSQITVRPEDQKEDLFRKVEIATIIGTLQSCVTRFRYLNPRWQKNCENERLLGVGMTGIMENDLLNGSGSKEELADLLSQLREHARAVNKKYAEILEINPSAAITCIKPAGNSTQLVGSHCSGLHEAYSRFYIRRNRMNKNDPVAKLLYMSGVPCEDEIFHPDTTWVFSYPMKAPKNAILRTDRTAIERLEHWLVYLDHWCEHNPSVTISVEEDEWLEVGAWVYKHFDKMVGVSFLPFSKHVYQQAPYEEISEEEYNKLVAEMPKDVNWELLKEIEKEDMTDSVKELACTSGACELA